MASSMSARTEIYRSDYLTLFLERNGRLIRIVRSAIPYPDVAALEHTYGKAYDTIKALRQQDLCMLVDQRLATGRNDPEFEQATARLRTRMYPLFRKRAILVMSMVGKLQFERLQREDGLERMVSQDEAELLRYLDV